MQVEPKAPVTLQASISMIASSPQYLALSSLSAALQRLLKYPSTQRAKYWLSPRRAPARSTFSLSTMKASRLLQTFNPRAVEPPSDSTLPPAAHSSSAKQPADPPEPAQSHPTPSLTPAV